MIWEAEEIKKKNLEALLQETKLKRLSRGKIYSFSIFPLPPHIINGRPLNSGKTLPKLAALFFIIKSNKLLIPRRLAHFNFDPWQNKDGDLQ